MLTSGIRLRAMSYFYDTEGYARQSTKKIPQNVPYSTWAPQMWKQFDSLGSNFKDSNSFASSVHNLIGQIPCPECKTDGESYVKSHPPEQVSSKTAAQDWVKAYHSHVDSVAKGWGRDNDPWYSLMWAELHLMADHFNPLTFADNVREQIDQIPCPPCSTHSLEFMEKYPPERVKSRSQAMNWMCRLHNMASYYAGNEIVDCAIDPEGYGYLSGHRDYPNDFFYGGGSRGGGQRGGQKGGHGHGSGGQRGGRGGRRGHRRGQQMQQGQSF